MWRRSNRSHPAAPVSSERDVQTHTSLSLHNPSCRLSCHCARSWDGPGKRPQAGDSWGHQGCSNLSRTVNESLNLVPEKLKAVALNGIKGFVRWERERTGDLNQLWEASMRKYLHIPAWTLCPLVEGLWHVAGAPSHFTENRPWSQTPEMQIGLILSLILCCREMVLTGTFPHLGEAVKAGQLGVLRWLQPGWFDHFFISLSISSSSGVSRSLCDSLCDLLSSNKIKINRKDLVLLPSTLSTELGSAAARVVDLCVHIWVNTASNTRSHFWVRREQIAFHESAGSELTAAVKMTSRKKQDTDPVAARRKLIIPPFPFKAKPLPPCKEEGKHDLSVGYTQTCHYLRGLYRSPSLCLSSPLLQPRPRLSLISPTAFPETWRLSAAAGMWPMAPGQETSAYSIWTKCKSVVCEWNGTEKKWKIMFIYLFIHNTWIQGLKDSIKYKIDLG